MSKEKLYGIKELLKKEMMVPGKDIIDRPYTVIPTTPNLDLALGGGIKSGSFMTISGKPKSGKALGMDAIIYTPTGPKRNGDLKVGDEVCTPFGVGVAKVDGVFPQGKMAVYKVTFNDGVSVECTEDHLWYVKKCNQENFEVLTLKQIVDAGLIKKDGTNKGRPRWQVPLCGPVKFNKRELLIDPYVMGCILGDGGITTKSVMFSNTDKELLAEFSSRTIEGYRLNSKGNDKDYCLTTGVKGKPNQYSEWLKAYGLHGKGSHDKFIPADYLLSSVDDRWLLLAGLLDTDGDVSGDGRSHITYSSVSKRLVDDFVFLVQSLGGICKVANRITKCNGKEFPSFRVHVKLTNKEKCFLLLRKKQRTKERTKKDLKRTIKSVEFVGHKECQCIHLDDEQHLYLTDGFVVTHNTTLCLQIIANAQKEKYGKRPAFYFDIEFRLGKKELTGIEGLVVAEGKEDFGLRVIRSTLGNIMSAEDILNSAEELIEMYPGCIIVLDSASAMSTADELASQVTASSRCQSPKLFANFLRKVKEKVPLNDCLFINISHLIANTSGYGAAFYEDGGNKKEYQNDTKLRVTSFSKWEEDGEIIGQEVEWRIFWSSLGKPGKSVKTRLRYGIGYDRIEEIITLALELCIIKQGGAWFTLPNEEKIQGRKNLADMLRENAELLESIQESIKELLS